MLNLPRKCFTSRASHCGLLVAGRKASLPTEVRGLSARLGCVAGSFRVGAVSEPELGLYIHGSLKATVDVVVPACGLAS